MTPREEYRIEVRRWIGDGHDRFTDDQIDAAHESFGIAWPQAWRVARRLRYLHECIEPAFVATAQRWKAQHSGEDGS